MIDKLKILFIGFGGFSKVRQRYLSEFSNVELVGFYDPYFSGEKKIHQFYDLNEAWGLCQAVIISVPPKFAPNYVSMALDKGVKVFCEKPAAVSFSDLSEVANHLKPDSMLAYGFNHREHPSIKKMKEVVETEVLGKVLWMRGRYGKEVDDSYKSTWRCNPDLNGGGILIDQGIHLVDLMSYLSGGFDGAQAVLSNNYLGIERVDDNGFITLYSTKSKIAASLHSTVTQWRYLFSLEIFLEHGSLILNGLRTNSGRYGEEILSIKPNSKKEADMGIQEIRYPENVSWRNEMEAFVEACCNNSQYPYANYSDACDTTKLMDLIYKKAVWL